MPTLLRRSGPLGLAPAVALLALVALLATAAPARAVEPGTTAGPADAVAGWLAAELTAEGGMLTVSFGGPEEFADQGLTIDAVLVLLAAGLGEDPAVDLAQGALAAQLDPYVTSFSTNPADRAANAVAKALLLEEISGQDISADKDLEADLRSLMEADGDDAGRFSDTDSQGYGNYANGIGQALAVLALERTPDGAPVEAVEYLLRQQCADGSFRLYQFGAVVSFDPYETVETHTCEDPAEGDPDATAFAVQALLEVPSTPAVAAALADAVDALLAQQGPDGGIEGTGAVNTNTTGLAAAALRAAGETAAADAGAAFVADLQLANCDDFGALAYDQAGFDAGIAADRAQWTRASAQGAFALGLPAYGDIGSAPPVPAGLDDVACPAGGGGPAPGPATVQASAPSVEAGGVVTLTASGFGPGEAVDIAIGSTRVSLGSAVADAAGDVVATVTIPADLEPGVHRIDLVGRSTGRTASVEVEVLARPLAPGARELPATGSPLAPLAALGSALVALGSGLARAGARRAT